MVRPLLSFDIEGTGVDPATDRIVQLAVLRPGFPMTHFTWLVNPQIPIPPGATEVHKITDDMVKDKPTFEDIAVDVHRMFEECDLLGFNLTNYDVPLLWEEFYRAGITWDLSETNVIDVGTLFKKREERTLSAAVKFYCDTELDNAHDALADAAATLQVWEAMQKRYPDLQQMDRAGQAKASQYDEVRYDLAGKIVQGKDGRPTYNIGKAKGVAVEDDPGFGRWMLSKDFTSNTKMVLESILYPERAACASDDRPW